MAVSIVIALECSAEAGFERIRTNAGGDRSGRVDDDPAAVARKLALYHSRTAPLIDHYASTGSAVLTVPVTATTTPQGAWTALQDLSR